MNTYKPRQRTRKLKPTKQLPEPRSDLFSSSYSGRSGLPILYSPALPPIVSPPSNDQNNLAILGKSPRYEPPDLREKQLSIGAGVALAGMVILSIGYAWGKGSAPAPVVAPAPQPQPIIVMPPADTSSNKNCKILCL
jgi:hypothetical protein